MFTLRGWCNMTGKDRLHELIEELPESSVPAAGRYLESLRQASDDPVLLAFMEAPEDDEPLTPEDIAAIEEANAEIERGELIPWEEIKARLFDRA
jgi:hypothetical protein